MNIIIQKNSFNRFISGYMLINGIKVGSENKIVAPVKNLLIVSFLFPFLVNYKKIEFKIDWVLVENESSRVFLLEENINLKYFIFRNIISFFIISISIVVIDRYLHSNAFYLVCIVFFISATYINFIKSITVKISER